MNEQELRELIAYQIERHYLPVCVCGRCGNEAENALINRILHTIRTGETDAI